MSAEDIKKGLEELDKFVRSLDGSIAHIYTKIEDVKNISVENGIAIGTIVDKSESTVNIAEEIQKQSAENKLMSEELGEIVSKFVLD